jgi:hypothetical protein
MSRGAGHVWRWLAHPMVGVVCLASLLGITLWLGGAMDPWPRRGNLPSVMVNMVRAPVRGCCIWFPSVFIATNPDGSASLVFDDRAMERHLNDGASRVFKVGLRRLVNQKGIWAWTREVERCSLMIVPISHEAAPDDSAVVREALVECFRADGSEDLTALAIELRAGDFTRTRVLWSGYAINAISLLLAGACLRSGGASARRACSFMLGRSPARRARLGQCVRCGYDLAGLPPGRCPECGSAGALSRVV